MVVSSLNQVSMVNPVLPPVMPGGNVTTRHVGNVNPVLPPVMPGGGGTTWPGHATRSVVDPPASPEVRLALS